MATQATPSQENRRVLTGLFPDRESTEGAYRSLRDRGYTDDEINVMMSDETRDKYYKDGTLNSRAIRRSKEPVPELPSAERSVRSSAESRPSELTSYCRVSDLSYGVPIAAGLAGAGAGGLTGGLVGALIGWGIPEERAVAYETGIRQGGTGPRRYAAY